MADFVHNKIEFEYADMDEAFPPVDCQHEPVGNYVIVQLRSHKKVTKGGLILPEETQDVERDNTQAAKVVSIGPTAFKHRYTGEDFTGGNWYKVGDFVRAPKYGGDRWQISYEREELEKVINGVIVPAVKAKTDAFFAMFTDTDIRARITGDPRRVKAYL